MTSRTSRLLLATALTAIATTALTGCNRSPDTQPTSQTPSTTFGSQVDDSAITARVKSALMADNTVSGSDVEVETRMGTVQLSGSVEDQGQVVQAGVIARGVDGVTNVENNITLRDSSRSFGTQMDDATTTAQVKAALLADANISGLDISVTTVQGEVQLTGNVDNQAQIEQAAEIARRAGGADRVKNELRLRQ